MIFFKDERLKILSDMKGNFSFFKGDIADKTSVDEIFNKWQSDIVVNLAAHNLKYIGRLFILEHRNGSLVV